MSLESDVYNLLSTDASISAVLGARPFVYNGAIPKGQPDSGAIVLNVQHTERLTGTDGPNRFTIKDVQIDSYHKQYTQALAISNAVFSLMRTLSGSLSTTQIQGTIPTREMDFGREPAQDGDGYVFRRLLGFDVQHTDLQSGDLANTYTASSIPAPGGNASLLEGVPVSVTQPVDGQVLVYSASAGQWVPGSSGGSTRKSFNESPDGVRTVFTLPGIPNPAAIQVFVAGQLQGPGQYTLFGNTLTLVFAPQIGDEMFAWY